MATTLTKSRVLIVDDEETVCWALKRSLAKEGYEVTVASSAEEALRHASVYPPDVVLLDVRLPGMSGIDAMERLLRMVPGVSIIVMTAYSRLSTAVEAVQQGAFDYFAKPFDLDVALAAVAKAIRQRSGRATSAHAAREPDELGEEMVGNSPAMQEVYKRIALAASSDASVVIQGETGVGKELVARAIHRFSDRHQRPFVPIHIAALNPHLIESELFGHQRGSFTGASDDRLGLFSMADGGTIFLDELGEIPEYLQVKLLRLLDQQEVTPVGGNVARHINVRILCATHQDLLRKVADGTFRQDLYFRLHVMDIVVPPLRERPGDIVPLVEHFLRQGKGRTFQIPVATRKHLESLPWPGNVRELRNAVERAQLLARSGPLLPEHFPARLPLEPQARNAGDRLAAAVLAWLEEELQAGRTEDLMNRFLEIVEPVLLGEVLRHTHGNRLAAAKWLGMHRATFRKKLGQLPKGEQEG